MNRKHKSSAVTQLRSQPHRRALASACALALFSIAGVHAQEAQTQPAQTGATPAPTNQVETLDAVRVTGIRAAIATSIETKNESTSIVEAISAEDLGKLPDISIADSIARLPGLATQRVDGRSQVINIRGMSEQFAGTLLNGREQVSTGDSRGVEFDQYPSELINAVVVYKTPDATLIGQGISGTVDLQTVRPLSLGERRIVFSGQAEQNSLGDLTSGGWDKGYRAAASYVDQFADDTIGVALGVARLNSPFQERHYKEWWWVDGNTLNGWGAPAQEGRLDDAIALQGWEGWVKSRELTRDGVMGVLEWKPNENLHSIVDMYYSKFEQNELMRGMMSNNDPWFTNDDGNSVGFQNLATSPYYGRDVVTSGTLVGVQPIVRNDNNTREDKLTSVGWNTSYKLDPMTFTLDLSYSRAERDQSVLETYAGMLDPTNITFNNPLYNRFGWYSTPDMSNPATVLLSDPQNYGHDGRMENSTQEDKLKAARFQFSRDIESSDFLRSYDLGVNYNKRTKEKRATVYFADLRNGRTPMQVDQADLRSPTSLNFLGLGNVLTYDPRAALGRYYDVNVSESNDDLLKDYIVEEEVMTWYAKANLDIDISDSLRLRGNVGVQYIHTDQESTGFNARDGVIRGGQTIGTSYGDILPSLNLALEMSDGWKVRLGAAKTLMRPPINYLSAASSAGVSTTSPYLWSGSGGNPLLEPYRANAVDLSVEKYMGDASYVALALFYKDLESYVYQQNFPNWDFSGYTNDTNNNPVSNFGNFSTWANGEGGYMRGAELSATLTGDLFTPALDGFGVQLNGSYTESSIDPDGPGGSNTDTIPGLSKVVANATVFYEKHGFSARVSERYRDQYRGEYSSLFGARQYRFTMPESVVDLQLSYDFAEGSSLHGLTLLFQVNNVNNEPFRTQVSEASGADPTFLFPEEYTEYGRQFLLGFRYEM
ncbi:iron complex outermembrane recepter protein [Pseudoxanthomonas indica]|uniref:Iron complex outermembrane recepter protein n=1 Tax=Pseudoxanthomonas indica TaxID=428993 RepID=A0A1T5KR51_9GAMM|nr:iron complex outermembrane recepter protein [Pseudoxanthomonas indica]